MKLAGKTDVGRVRQDNQDDYRAVELPGDAAWLLVCDGMGGDVYKRQIQTTDPDNPVLILAAAQDYDAFFEQEIAYRKLGLYPPFCGLCVKMCIRDRRRRCR